MKFNKDFVPVAENFSEKYRDLVMKCLLSSGLTKEDIDEHPERIRISMMSYGGVCQVRYFVDGKYLVTLFEQTMFDYAAQNIMTLAFRTILWMEIEKNVGDLEDDDQ